MALLTDRSLFKISPEQTKAFRKAACSLTLFRDHLYLSVAYAGTQQSWAQIFRYDPSASDWEVVYQAPPDSLEAAQPLPVDCYSNSAVLRDQDGPSSLLYTSLLSACGSQTVYSEDGRTFQVAANAGPEGLEILAARRLLAFGQQLYALPIVRGADATASLRELPLVYITTEPKAGPWQAVSPPGFGDPNNEAIAQLVAFNDCLYAGTANPEQGFQVWKTQGKGQADATWQLLLSEGVRRYTLNYQVASMLVFKGALYIASGGPVSGHGNLDNPQVIDPEIIRLYADDSWDLIVGAPKFTPTGLKVPLSAIGTGFEDLSGAVLQGMMVHQDCLYVGLKGKGGLHFWVTEDGETWQPLLLEPLSHRSRSEVYAMASTPFGSVFVLGTSHNQDPDPAAGSAGLRQLEVWLGQ